MRLIVNLPAFNEAEKIGETIRRIPRQIKGVDEVFVQVTDDGSKDDTVKI
ncbi:MAG: glycosyltransferase, partial [Candidatus Moranbacteria bacterium]|nr:glycosyltransferase [Candidatus Moranbacteria bacterium]